jgi:hypothetical protein
MIKPVQQRVGAQLGLKTPPSIVSTNYNAVVEYADVYGILITKSLGGHRILFKDQKRRLPEVVTTMSCKMDSARPFL